MRTLPAVLAVASLAGCMSFDPLDDTVEYSGEDVAAIESVARIDLPPEASVVRAVDVGFQDTAMHTRFTIPPAALDTFLASTVCEALTAPDPAAPTPHDLVGEPWWNPGAGRPFRTCRSDMVGSYSHYILVEDDNPTALDVFVVTIVP